MVQPQTLQPWRPGSKYVACWQPSARSQSCSSLFTRSRLSASPTPRLLGAYRRAICVASLSYDVLRIGRLRGAWKPRAARTLEEASDASDRRSNDVTCSPLVLACRMAAAQAAELTPRCFTIPVEDGLLHIQLLDLGLQARVRGNWQASAALLRRVAALWRAQLCRWRLLPYLLCAAFARAAHVVAAVSCAACARYACAVVRVARTRRAVPGEPDGRDAHAPEQRACCQQPAWRRRRRWLGAATWCGACDLWA